MNKPPIPKQTQLRRNRKQSQYSLIRPHLCLPHVSKTLQPILQETVQNVPRYHGAPRHNIPLRHFIKHLLRKTNFSVSHVTRQHGVPCHHVAAKGVFFKHPFGRTNTGTITIKLNQSVPNKHVACITELNHVRVNVNTQEVKVCWLGFRKRRRIEE